MGIETTTLLLIAGGITAGAAAGGAFGGGGGKRVPSVQAGTPRRTAAPVEQLSEQARRNRRRQRSLLTRDLEEPQLGIPRLFGVGE